MGTFINTCLFYQGYLILYFVQIEAPKNFNLIEIFLFLSSSIFPPHYSALGKTCSRLSPLLGCDYCGLHFHLECVDPPLTAPPTLTWMCPAHAAKLTDEWCGNEGGGVVERSEVWEAWATQPLNEAKVSHLGFRRKKKTKFVVVFLVHLTYLKKEHRQ